jgi:hypothetical protein
LKLFTFRREPPHRIEIRDDGFEVTDGAKKISGMRWDDISRVAAFKRDCFSVDMICISLSDGTWEIEVNEDLEGWKALLNALAQNVSNFPPYEQWFMQIAQPPFATNFTLIYQRR